MKKPITTFIYGLTLSLMLNAAAHAGAYEQQGLDQPLDQPLDQQALDHQAFDAGQAAYHKGNH